MSVYKNPKTGRWFCVYRIRDIKGKLIQRRKDGFETRELAYQYECKAISENNSIVKYKVKFQQLYNEFILFYKDNRSISTIDSYNYCYGKYFSKLNNRYVASITFSELNSFRSEIIKTNISCKRINTIFGLLKNIFEFGIKNSYLNNNPCNFLEPLHDYSVKESKVDFYTVEEFKQFISVVPDDSMFYVAFNLLYYTGVRVGELLALNIGDINLNKSLIKINKTIIRKNKKIVTKATKTQSSNDVVYIPSALRQILAQYIKGKGYNFPLFYTDKKKRLSKKTLENKKNYYCDLCGLRRIRIHDFRHSFASLVYELSDYNFSEVAKRLRHSDISTVMKTYIHVFPSRRNAVDNKLDNI